VTYWLFKSEPSSWSWEEQVAAGEAGTNWNGVRNHQAKLNLQAMRRGDRGFFYHSGEGKAIVGVVEVVEEYRPDPSDETGRFGMVDVRAVEALAEPVTLDRIKAEPRLKDMALVRLARLSVQPVAEGEWGIVQAMAGN
jgi:predicted RNA-binding protein with PUA-like domain